MKSSESRDAWETGRRQDEKRMFHVSRRKEHVHVLLIFSGTSGVASAEFRNSKLHVAPGHEKVDQSTVTTVNVYKIRLKIQRSNTLLSMDFIVFLLVIYCTLYSVFHDTVIISSIISALVAFTPIRD